MCHFNSFPVNVFHAVTRFFKGIQSWTKWSGLRGKGTIAKESTRSLVTSFPAIWLVNSFSTGHEVTAPFSVMAPMSSSGWQRAKAQAPRPPPVALTFQFYFTTFIILTSRSFLHRLNNNHPLIIPLFMSFGEAVMEQFLCQVLLFHFLQWHFGPYEYGCPPVPCMVLLWQIMIIKVLWVCLSIPKVLRFNNMCVCLNLVQVVCLNVCYAQHKIQTFHGFSQKWLDLKSCAL